MGIEDLKNYGYKSEDTKSHIIREVRENRTRLDNTSNDGNWIQCPSDTCDVEERDCKCKEFHDGNIYCYKCQTSILNPFRVVNDGNEDALTYFESETGGNKPHRANLLLTSKEVVKEILLKSKTGKTRYSRFAIVGRDGRPMKKLEFVPSVEKWRFLCFNKQTPDYINLISRDKWIGLHKLNTGTKRLFIVAGEWDYLHMCKKFPEHTFISPINGESQIKDIEQFLDLIDKDCEIRIIYDNDKPDIEVGEKIGAGLKYSCILARSVAKKNHTNVHVMDFGEFAGDINDLDDYLSQPPVTEDYSNSLIESLNSFIVEGVPYTLPLEDMTKKKSKLERSLEVSEKLGAIECQEYREDTNLGNNIIVKSPNFAEHVNSPTNNVSNYFNTVMGVRNNILKGVSEIKGIDGKWYSVNDDMIRCLYVSYKILYEKHPLARDSSFPPPLTEASFLTVFSSVARVNSFHEGRDFYDSLEARPNTDIPMTIIEELLDTSKATLPIQKYVDMFVTVCKLQLLTWRGSFNELKGVMNNQKPCRFFMILQSPEQYIGKTTFLGKLYSFAVERGVYSPAYNFDDRDGALSFLRYLVMNVDDFTSLKRADEKQLKTIMSQPMATGRGAWQRARTNQEINGVFVGSTNETSFLKDYSNTRFIIFPVKQVNLNKITNSCISGFWSHIKFLVERDLADCRDMQPTRDVIIEWDKSQNTKYRDVDQMEVLVREYLTPINSKEVYEKCLQEKNAVLKHSSSELLKLIRSRYIGDINTNWRTALNKLSVRNITNVMNGFGCYSENDSESKWLYTLNSVEESLMKVPKEISSVYLQNLNSFSSSLVTDL